MRSNTPRNLTRLTSSLEQLAKTLRKGTPGKPATKAMSLEQFVAHATREIEKAVREQPGAARARLATLKRQVDVVIERVAAMHARDVDVAKIDLPIETSFAPSGGTMIDGVTTADAQSSTELAMPPPTPSADSSFAQNLKDVAKTLDALKRSLGNDEEAPRARTRKTNAAPAAWPRDLASVAFRKGGREEASAPAWGYDPDFEADADADAAQGA